MDQALENSSREEYCQKETSTSISKDCIICFKIPLSLFKIVSSLVTSDRLKFEASVNDNKEKHDALFCTRTSATVEACTLCFLQESCYNESLDVSCVASGPTGFTENSLTEHSDSHVTDFKPVSSIASGQTIFPENFWTEDNDNHPYTIKKESKTADEILSFAPPNFCSSDTQSCGNVQDAWEAMPSGDSNSDQGQDFGSELNNKFLKHCKSAVVHLKRGVSDAVRPPKKPRTRKRRHKASAGLDKKRKGSKQAHVALSSEDESNGNVKKPTNNGKSKTKTYKKKDTSKSQTEKAKRVRRKSTYDYRDRPHKCSHCKQTFDTPDQLNKHLECLCRILFPHIPYSRYYSCEHCTYSTRFKDEFDEHMQTHPRGLKSHLCEVCGLKCSSRSSVCMHRRIAHGLLKPLPLYTCGICGKTNYHKGIHRIHELMHTGEKPEMCDICGKRFWKKTDLNAHVRGFHLGQFKYTCDKCGHGLHKKSALRSHVCGRTRKRRTWRDPTNVAAPAKDACGEPSLTPSPHSDQMIMNQK